MLRFTDFSDFCDLTDGEIQSISSGANVPYIEACALAHEAEDNPESSRAVLKMMQQHLERVEKNADGLRSKEIHLAINNFAATHKFT
ncbi:hypothetical protein GCM10009133_26440 [Cocleimonas flava]|jgi:cytochrome c553|uniref:Uncharacterized protein n=1 Tax=Cocleimonas flava TaxID=634765 RepID=A0A4R1ETU6_9GAMM|nr:MULTISPECIES: hypothetical protein [Cocleimonas]MEB8432760.1 hypothetical protein [Cocleimonas sp. KMM 6892]MEC4715619.1 hypothetical protein [Cocleimonas sp. KMM 6895]MEC4744763.1 hypothetical protein [Cocleimonas sp. KMM 6896]TCJ83179.1 hypothetical protein EV695_3917 [Cocleimonas flava]